MDYADIRAKIRAVILSTVGFVVALLLLRVALDLISASSNNILVGFIHTITDFLTDPFKDVIEIPASSGLQNLNVDALVAALVYILGGIALSEIVTSFVYENFEDIFQNLIDGVFKVIEFLILLRIVFYFFDIGLVRSESPSFIKVVYDLTDWTQSTGLNITFLSDYLDWDAIVILTIVVILDLLAERFLQSIFKRIETTYKKVSTIKKPADDFKPPAPPIPVANPQIPQQNIIVNVPMPPQPTFQPNPQPQPLNVNITNPIPVQPQNIFPPMPEQSMPLSPQNTQTDSNGIRQVTGAEVK